MSTIATTPKTSILFSDFNPHAARRLTARQAYWRVRGRRDPNGMWAKLDDALLDHRKIFEAGRLLGRDGRAKALGFYAAGLLYANKHLTDGFLSTGVVEGLNFVDKPLVAAKVMVEVKLWDVTDGGFLIHDYHDENPWAKKVQEKRKSDRERKRKSAGVHAG